MRPQFDSFCARLLARASIAVVVVTLGACPLMAAMNEPVSTDAGQLLGVQGKDPSISVYKGIPFAATPVGELRWKAPFAKPGP